MLSSLVGALLLLTLSCAQTNQLAPESNVGESVVSSTPPFQTKEPERYRATRTLTTVTTAGETVVSRLRVARDGELRREEVDVVGNRVVYLYLPEGNFVLLPNEKLFADVASTDQTLPGGAVENSESSPDRLLHTDPVATTYQRMGAETIGGRKTQKYRVVVNGSPGQNVSVGETLVWIDDALQIPIRSEAKATGGGRATTELTDITLDVDQSLFQIPGDLKKITYTELRKRLNQD